MTELTFCRLSATLLVMLDPVHLAVCYLAQYRHEWGRQARPSSC